MANNGPTDAGRWSAIRDRIRDGCGRALAAVRRLPYLTSAAALAGLALLVVITLVRSHNLLADTPENAQLHYKLALSADALKTFKFEFFLQQWKLGAVLLLPAIILAIVRQRGAARSVALTMVTLAFFALWLADDFHDHWDNAHNTTMGEIPAPGAYYLKLVIIGAAILSVPFLHWAYYRASIMDRYVVRSFAAPFLLCLCGIIGIMITMDLLNNANDFIKAGFSLGMVAKFYLQQLPQILVMILDVSVLLASIYTLWRMSRFNEIISAMGGGRSLVRFLVPVLAIGAWCSLIALAMNYEWAPAAQNGKDAMLRNADKTEARRRKELNSTYNVMYRNSEDNRTWFLNRVPNSLDGGPIDFVAIFQDDGKGKLVQSWHARRAGWSPLQKEWRLYGAHVSIPQRMEKEFVIDLYDKYPIEGWRETPWSILSGKIMPEFLSVPELVSYMKTNADLPDSSLAKYRTTLHSRFALPMRCFLIVLVAAPLGVSSSRRGMLTRVAAAILIFIATFFLYTIFVKTAEGGTIAPFAGAWLTSFALLALGCLLLWMRNYNRTWSDLLPRHWLRR